MEVSLCIENKCDECCRNVNLPLNTHEKEALERLGTSLTRVYVASMGWEDPHEERVRADGRKLFRIEGDCGALEGGKCGLYYDERRPFVCSEVPVGGSFCDLRRMSIGLDEIEIN